MTGDERQQEILKLVGERGFVTIEALAVRFDVTPQTIRRDINRLSEQGAVLRYHGGAGLPSSARNTEYADRQISRLAEKERIAARLAADIPDNSSLFINIGTTTEAVARALHNHTGLRVITNNINVARILMARSDFEVLIAGGIVRNADGGIVGEATIDFINAFKVDFGIIGCSGIDPDGTLLDFDTREVRVAQAILANSRRVFLVADHTKFNRGAMVKLAPLDAVTALYTDRRPNEQFAALLADRGVALVEADGEGPVGETAKNQGNAAVDGPVRNSVQDSGGTPGNREGCVVREE